MPDIVSDINRVIVESESGQYDPDGFIRREQLRRALRALRPLVGDGRREDDARSG